jgi:hypothetical protein
MRKQYFLLIAIVLFSLPLAFSYTLEGDKVVVEDAQARLEVWPYTSGMPVGEQQQYIKVINKQEIEYTDLRLGFYFAEPIDIRLFKERKAKYEKVKRDYPRKWDIDFYDYNYETTGNALNPYFVTVWHDTDENGSMVRIIDFQGDFSDLKEKNRKLELKQDKTKMKDARAWESFSYGLTEYGWTNHGYYYYSDLFALSGTDSEFFEFDYTVDSLIGKYDLFVFGGDPSCAVNGTCEPMWLMDPWYDGNFTCKANIDINIEYLTTDLVNPVIFLNFNPADLETGGCQFKAGGADFRPVNNEETKVLPYMFDGNWAETDLNLWVKVDDLNQDKPDENIWIYFNNGLAVDGENPNNVWSDYNEVLLFESKCPALGCDNMLVDSTGKHSPSPNDNMQVENDGNIGNAFYETGYVNTNFEFENNTNMSWIMTATQAAAGKKLWGASNVSNVFAEWSDGADSKMRFYLNEGGLQFDLKSAAFVWSDWSWLAFSCGLAGAKLYVGNQISTNADTSCPIAINTNMLIGARPDDPWTGRIDSVRLIDRQITNEEARLFQLGEERSLILDIGDTNQIPGVIERKIHLKIPKDESSGANVVEYKYYTSGIYITDANNLTTDVNITITPDTYGQITIHVQDVNEYYYPRAYVVDITADTNVYMVQPYLIKKTDGALVTFYALNKYTREPLPFTLFKITRQIGTDFNVVVESSQADSAGATALSMLTNLDYNLLIYYQGNFMTNFVVKPLYSVYKIDLVVTDLNFTPITYLNYRTLFNPAASMVCPLGAAPDNNFSIQWTTEVYTNEDVNISTFDLNLMQDGAGKYVRNGIAITDINGGINKCVKSYVTAASYYYDCNFDFPSSGLTNQHPVLLNIKYTLSDGRVAYSGKMFGYISSCANSPVVTLRQLGNDLGLVGRAFIILFLNIFMLAAVNRIAPLAGNQGLLVMVVLGFFAYISILTSVTWLPVEVFATLATIGLIHEWRSSK